MEFIGTMSIIRYVIATKDKDKLKYWTGHTGWFDPYQRQKHTFILRRAILFNEVDTAKAYCRRLNKANSKIKYSIFKVEVNINKFEYNEENI